MEIRQPAERLPTLINGAIDSVIALPEFQRGFIWKPAAVKLLLSSVAQGWPIGSFLLWKPDRQEIDLAPRRIRGLPDVEASKIEWFVLDGQQRLTALIHALREDTSEHIYYIQDMPDVLQGQSELDDKIRSLKKAAFDKRYPTIERRAKRGVAKISDLIGGAYFDWWGYRQHTMTNDDLDKLRLSRLPGFVEYSVPCILIPQDTELLAVARIFDTTNRTGVKLGTVDLMTARLYPFDFRLRDEWDDVITNNRDVLVGFGVTSDEVEQGTPAGTVDAEDVLRLIAYLKGGATGATVTRDKILKLDHAEVKEMWAGAIEAFVEAVKWVRMRCGVVNGKMLPAPLMLLPLAVAFRTMEVNNIRGARRREILDVVERWFWVSVVQDRYGSSTNTVAKRDADAFQLWLTGGAIPPSVVITEEREALKSSLIERLMDADGGEESLESGVLSLIVQRGADDWAADKQKLSDLGSVIQKHHIFPSKADLVKQWKAKDASANLTPQSQESNIALGNAMPATHQLQSGDVKPHFVELDCLDISTEEEFDAFLESRAGEIAEELLTRAWAASQQ